VSYASKQSMIDRFGEAEIIQLTDRAGVGVVDDVVLNMALASADAEIDGYLQVRYVLPLASTPLLISNLAANMARYHLHDDVPPELVADRYSAAIKALGEIASGKQKLGLDGLNKETPQSNLPKITGPARLFDRSSMQDF